MSCRITNARRAVAKLRILVGIARRIVKINGIVDFPKVRETLGLIGLSREKWRAPTEEPGGVLWETGTGRRRSFGVKRCGWH
ncbi:4-hydroxyphenylacetate 3-hydroxylase C-terminal domain-containing protein [Tabrizicola soli]|uniref:4-hydroxyphenylacetate 3-hydroxylase C-terminal domain-containing protein n=1 Tax=Tabrizicola soli TaxID=2185115 RepID=UPI0018D3860C|nr:4-hydroxyphenylacetate 3-hydroxylase C-terminal domain-containing protein [Tabrizicola soli]